MILGIGIDVVDSVRISRVLDRYGRRFAKRVFTEKEQEYCSQKHNPIESYAARFAVKEAAFKALGRGWDECGGFTSVEVVSDAGNLPHLVFHGEARRNAEILGVHNAHVSITHDGGIAAAVVVLER